MKSCPNRKCLARNIFEKGIKMELGMGKSDKPDEALQSFRRAAILGERQAQFFLAIQYASMPLTRKNQRLAVAWFRRAVLAGEELCALVSQDQDSTPEDQLRLFRELIM